MTNDECGMTNVSKGPGRLRWVPPGAARKAAGAMHVTEREEALMRFVDQRRQALELLERAKHMEYVPAKRLLLRAARDCAGWARRWLATACGEGVAA